MSMIKKGSAVPHRVGQTHAERIAMSRFFHNDRVKQEELAYELTSHWYKDEYRGRDLCVIQDTSDYSAFRHKGRLDSEDPDLGPVWKNDIKKELGFFVHPALVIDAKTDFPLGYSRLHIWNRKKDAPDRHERNYKRQPIEEKTSYRWQQTIELSRQVLTDHRAQIYHIMDREADIWELFVQSLPSNEHLIIRTNRDRIIYTQQGLRQKLWGYLKEQSSKAIIEVKLDSRAGQAKRTAQMALYYEKLKIARPKDRTKAQGPDKLALSIVQIKEVESSVPLGQKAIHWCIWTDLEIDSIQTAIKVIQLYKKRWSIEELFSLLKSKGLEAESAQLEKGKALKKLVLLALQAALILIQLMRDRDNKHGESATLILDQKDLQFLELLIKSMEGNTDKLKNPYPKGSLARLAWAIARLGGFSGYQSQSPPGPKTMTRGWRSFLQQLSAWQLVMNINSS